MERNFVCVRVKACWIVGSGLVKEEDVEDKNSSDDEGEEEVKCEEPGKGSIVYGETSSDSLNEGVSYIRYGGKKVSNNCCTSK